MTSEVNKRVLTSILLILIVSFAFFYSFVLIILLILISIFSWIEFKGLINKIIIGERYIDKILRSSFIAITLIYLFYFSTVVFKEVSQVQLSEKINIIYFLSICISSDIGGFLFGKIFKGKKLTKISPNKTFSGMIGSFCLSLILVPFFLNFSPIRFDFFDLAILAISVSFICQLGDLFVSFMKRKAKVKDTGDLLPGHGGILDRIDGIIFALPLGTVLSKFLVVLS